MLSRMDYVDIVPTLNKDVFMKHFSQMDTFPNKDDILKNEKRPFSE